MELLRFIQILWYRRREILLTALITVVVAVIGRALVPVQYTSSAILRVIPYSSDNPSYTQLAYATRIMKTYVEIGSSSVIMSNLRKDLGLTPDQPASIEIEIIPDTELLQIKVSDYDPVLTSDVANALAAELISDNSIRDVRVSLIEPASVPKPPSTFSVIVFYVLALFVGLLGGIGLVFVLENIDPRLYNGKQAQTMTGLPVLGHIPAIPRSHLGKVVAGYFPYNHAFQRLGINLQAVSREKKLRFIMVTSAETGEGKSLIAANLAYSLARSGHKTLLVDADMRRPVQHTYFALTNELGFGDVLFSNASLDAVIREGGLGLTVMTGGSVVDDYDMSLLEGERAKKIFGQVANQWDYVILDTPAFLGLADSMILSRLVDGILLVIRLGETSQDLLEVTIQQLEKLQVNILGLVINHSRDNLAASHYHANKRERISAILTNLWTSGSRSIGSSRLKR